MPAGRCAGGLGVEFRTDCFGIAANPAIAPASHTINAIASQRAALEALSWRGVAAIVRDTLWTFKAICSPARVRWRLHCRLV